MEEILRALAKDLKEKGGLDLEECYIDGTFIAAKRGLRGGKDQAGQRLETHGNGRKCWSSYLRMRHEC